MTRTRRATHRLQRGPVEVELDNDGQHVILRCHDHGTEDRVEMSERVSSLTRVPAHASAFRAGGPDGVPENSRVFRAECSRLEQVRNRRDHDASQHTMEQPSRVAPDHRRERPRSGGVAGKAGQLVCDPVLVPGQVLV